MNNDLISRGEAKKLGATCLARRNDNGQLEAIISLDNAPTVVVPENEVNCVLTMFGKCSYNETGCSDCEIKDKIRKALNEKQTGEWVISQTMDCHSDIIDIYTCPFCGKREYSAYPYCHCGARMKGGAE